MWNWFLMLSTISQNGEKVKRNLGNFYKKYLTNTE